MIRFIDGAPQALWFSQHSSGEAFTYDCLLKINGRPVDYSGRGTHANYAIAGCVDYMPLLSLLGSVFVREAD